MSSKISAILKIPGKPGPILIAMGANIPSSAGSPAQTLKLAITELERSGVEILRVSPFYETTAWPDPADPPYLNAAARIETKLDAEALLLLLHHVETVFDRKRSAKNAPRTLDLDLIDYRGQIAAEGPVLLPHPRAANRRFVLEPLRDVAPDWHHPVTGQGIAALLAALP